MASTMLLFALLLTLVFSFAFELAGDRPAALAGMLWTTLLFSAILGLGRSFATEKADGSLHGLMLAPADRAAIFYGKAAGNLIFTLATAAITGPLLFLLLSVPVPPRPWFLTGVVGLGTLGLVAAGTFLAALAAHTRASELLLPIMLLPVAVPLLLAAVNTTAGLLSGAPVVQFGMWIGLMGAFAATFLTLPLILFPVILEV